YEETAASIQSRETAAEQRKVMRGAMAPRPDRRPDKKQRRDILKQKSHLSES
ncbi:heat-shock protein, partial [Pseudoalteromonas sp. S4492]